MVLAFIRTRPTYSHTNLYRYNMGATVAIYPGSFNPWHQGHEDVLKKALAIFDKVVVLQFSSSQEKAKDRSFMQLYERYGERIEAGFFGGLLADCLKDFKVDAIIRGLRNGNDLEYEINLQYWNEDLGIDIPFVYFITDRKYSHISSSAIREVRDIKGSDNDIILRYGFNLPL